MANELDYVVGWGKPPMHSRFRKGQSGNPKGRRKESKDIPTTLRELLDGKITVIEDGKRRTITKREAMLKQLVNKAVSGDHRARNQVFQLTDNDPTHATEEAEEKAEAERLANGGKNLNLLYRAIEILVDLGIPLPRVKDRERLRIDTVDTKSIYDRTEDAAVETTSILAVSTSPQVEDAPSSRELLPGRLDPSNANVSPEHDDEINGVKQPRVRRRSGLDDLLPPPGMEPLKVKWTYRQKKD